MTAYVIAIAIYALLSAGERLGWSVAKYTRTVTPNENSFYGLTWLAIAGGAIWVLLT